MLIGIDFLGGGKGEISTISGINDAVFNTMSMFT